jgi:predicted metal-dependent HD superfamily phosphohydrolase
MQSLNDISLILDCKSSLNIKNLYNEPHRKFHTLNHVQNILSLLNINIVKSGKENKELLYAAIYHDSVYDILSKENEENSFLFFEKECNNSTINHDLVNTLILATKDPF